MKATEKRKLWLPDGSPRYVRSYVLEGKDGARVADPYTIVFTGRRGEGFYLSAGPEPTAPGGFCQSGETALGQPLDANGSGWGGYAIGRRSPTLGLRIKHSDLPPALRRHVETVYCDLWDCKLPKKGGR